MSIKPGFGKSCKFMHLGLLSLAPMAGTKSTTSYWAFMTMLIVLVSRVQTGLNVLYYNKHLQAFRAQTNNYLNKNTHIWEVLLQVFYTSFLLSSYPKETNTSYFPFDPIATKWPLQNPKLSCYKYHCYNLVFDTLPTV